MGSDSDAPLAYRLLTGDTSRAFCERVSGALEDGYRLYGDPVMVFDGNAIVTAQAVVRADLDDDGSARG